MPVTNRKALIFTLGAALTLVGCGGSGNQDEGSNDSNTQFSGVAVDGYLAGSLVYVDLNENGSLDATEPRTHTDSQGQFDLQGNVPGGSILVRMVGGYDTTTGEPFNSSLALRTFGSTDLTQLVSSPLTALLASAGADRRDDLLSRLTRPQAGDQAVTQGEAGTDFLADEIDVLDEDLMRAALLAQKPVTAMADLLEDHYPGLGDEADLPPDATAAVYDALVDELLATSDSLEAFMDSDINLRGVLDLAESRIRQRYRDGDLSLPSALTDQAKTDRAVRTYRLAIAVKSAFDNTVTPDNIAGGKLQKLRGASRAVEVVLRKIMADSDDYLDAARWIDNHPNDVAALGDDTREKDLERLIDADMDPADGDQARAATIPADSVPLTQYIGQRLQFRYSDGTETGAVLAYMEGDATDAQGELTLCIRYQDSASDDELETQGTFFAGNWSRMPADSDFTMVFTATVLGSERAMQLRSLGRNASNEAEFEYDYDDTGTGGARWAGSPSPQSVDGVAPDSNSACEQRLAQVFPR